MPLRADSEIKPDDDQIRVATFNVSLFGKRPSDIARRLSSGGDVHASKIAAIIRTVRPDILLINELDFSTSPSNASLFEAQYLRTGDLPSLGPSDSVGKPIAYPHQFSAPSNTGVDSEQDLNDNGKMNEPADAYGFGRYPGQYAFAVLSRFPIDQNSLRTFAKFKWSDLPGALQPIDPKTEQPYYSDDIWKSLRLSSKNHVDVPIIWGNRRLHILACHPTPPVFDGREDRNGCRNHDEILFWKHYLDDSTSLVDDQGARGGLDGWSGKSIGDPFVVLGDLNSDPSGGDSRQQAIQQLLADDRTQDVAPEHRGHPTKQNQEPRPSSTAQWRSGEMRVDYVLPSANAHVVDSGVFWPQKGETGHDWIDASDHRLVWVDMVLQRPPEQPRQSPPASQP